MPTRVIASIDELKTLVGQPVGVSDWFLVSQQLIDTFAKITEDRQWIHVDPIRAKAESPLGTTIAHGFLTVALLTHMQMQAVRFDSDAKMLINYGFNRLRFSAPVPAGARIRLHTTLVAIEDLPGALQATWGLKVEIENQPKPALVAEWLVRLILK
jgi:acyl dehydratase